VFELIGFDLQIGQIIGTNWTNFDKSILSNNSQNFDLMKNGRNFVHRWQQLKNNSFIKIIWKNVTQTFNIF